MQSPSTPHARSGARTLALPNLCFILASATIVLGMGLGMYMGIAHDFTLAPVHAHLNLLGWVSLFLIGLYYRAHPNAINRMAHAQVAGFIGGYALLVSGMTGLFISGHKAFLPFAIVGSVMLISSMAAFFVICLSARE